jgi:uncharacterized RDD family membrane protein YckC
VDRRDIGSWLSGPSSVTPPGAQNQDWRGQLLGCPETGPGSVAGFGRRVVALMIDWFGSILVVTLLSGGRYGFGAAPEDAARTQLLTLAVFAIEVALLTWLGGASAGQRVVGLAVRRIDGQRVPLLAAIVRTVLICLVIPPVVYDRDGRGLHDRAAASIVLRAR